MQIEQDLLLKAQNLLGQVVSATCSGQKLLQPPAPAEEEAPVDAKSGKGGKAAKPSKPAKGAPVAAEPVLQSTTDNVEIVCEIEAWHVDVLFRTRVLVSYLLFFSSTQVSFCMKEMVGKTCFQF